MSQDAIDPATPEGVARLAALARVPLTPAEAADLRLHLGRMLGWLARLEAADPGGDALGALPVGRAALRSDDPAAPLPRPAALALGPETADGAFWVPPVLPGAEGS